MSWATPHTWTAGDDALSSYLQSMTDASLQLQGLAPSTGIRLDYFVGNLTVAQSIPNSGANTPLALVEELDDANGHSDSTNPSRYVAKNAGRVMLVATGMFAIDSSGFRGFMWLKNGSPINGTQMQQMAVTTGNETGQCVVTEVAVNGTTDYLEFAARHNSSTGAIDVTNARVLIRSVHA
jgi:hypothetical protein